MASILSIHADHSSSSALRKIIKPCQFLVDDGMN